MSMRTPAETVSLYLDQLYNQGRTDLAADFISDPTWRHQEGKLEQFSLAETVARLKDNFKRWPTMRFDAIETLVDGDRVAVAWNGHCTKPDGEIQQLFGIEIFRVRDGRIVEIWNSKEWPGLWQTSPLR